MKFSGYKYSKGFDEEKVILFEKKLKRRQYFLLSKADLSFGLERFLLKK